MGSIKSTFFVSGMGMALLLGMLAYLLHGLFWGFVIIVLIVVSTLAIQEGLRD